MKRGVWWSSLVLSMGGWLARMEAQERYWQAVPQQLTPVALTGSELRPCPVGPGAALGRPIVIATARPVGTAAQGTPQLTPVSYESSGGTELLPVPAGRAPLPAWPEEAEGTLDNSELIGQVSLFGSDRAGAVARSDSQQVVAEPPPAPKDDTTETAPPPKPLGIDTVTLVAAHDAVDGPLPDPLHTHYFVKAEYLLWGIRPYHVPPLVTTGSVNDDPGTAGALGQPNTRVLFGDSDLAGGARSGVRLTAGAWFDMWQEEGFEVGGFFLGDKTNSFTTNSAQNPVIARPFFDLNNQRQFREIVASPAANFNQTGNIAINAPSRFFGVEANYVRKICCGCDYRVDLLAGFRYLNLDEDLNITENIVFNNPPVENGTAIDDFHTKNQFYGGQVGVAAEKHWGAWSLEGRFKVALGATSQDVSINGAQRFTPDSTINANGGLLALSSNSGNHSETRFSVVPEIDLNLGYQINDHWRAFVGYNFLYWSSVVRPGDQIDTVLDISKIPNFIVNPPATAAPTGQNRPAVLFKESDFWAQGLTVGLEFRY